jgi:hypothetical protein
MTITRILALACCVGLYGAAWSAEEEGKKLTLDQLPAAVKAALLQQAGGAKIEDIEEETKDGKTVYEAEIVGNGVTTEVKLDASGKILKTKVEKEGDDDKDEQGEKHEKKK